MDCGGLGLCDEVSLTMKYSIAKSIFIQIPNSYNRTKYLCRLPCLQLTVERTQLNLDGLVALLFHNAPSPYLDTFVKAYIYIYIYID